MDYKKYNLKNINLHIIKTDRFKTINVRIAFKRKIIKEEITLRNMLADIILESSKKYSTVRDMQIEKENLYGCLVGSRTYRNGDYNILVYNLKFLNEYYTEEGMNEETINFFLDTILNPNVENAQFNEKSYQFVYNSLKDYINSVDDNPRYHTSVRVDEIIGANTSLAYHSCGYIEDLEKSSSKRLYEYYNDVLENDIIDVFVLGNIDEDKIKKIFENKKIRNKENQLSESHEVKLENNLRNNEIIEESKFKQSKLKLIYNIESLTDFERKYVLQVYSFILGGGNDSKLFEEVREKNSLCYYVSATGNWLYKILEIESGIDKKDYEKAVSVIKEQVDAMKDGKFNQDDIDKVVTYYISACKNIYDNPVDIINNYQVHEYLKNDLIEERIEKIKTVTKEDIIALAKKINLTLVYLLEGGNEDE